MGVVSSSRQIYNKPPTYGNGRLVGNIICFVHQTSRVARADIQAIDRVTFDRQTDG
jgi:hypothetical protein